MPAYNNYFPATYQQPVTYPNLGANLTQNPLSQPSSSILWVQGESGAKAYPVASGNSVLLMDSEEKVFYIKTTDVTGVPQPLRKFSYEEVTDQVITEPSIDTSNFITRDEFEAKFAELDKKKKEAKQ